MPKVDPAAIAPATDLPPIDAAFAGATEQPGDEIEGKDWTKGAIIVAGGEMPARPAGKPVIIVEAWSDNVFDQSGAVKKAAAVKTSGYPDKGDLYYRTDPAVDFGANGPVLTMGVDVMQAGFWGFSERPGFVNVGPASPVFAAMNIAWQHGARDIEVRGLTDDQKERLQPFINDLTARVGEPRAESAHAPAQADVTITLA